MADQMPTGARVQDYSSNEDITAADLNAIQDEVIHALEARRWDLTSGWIYDEGGANPWRGNNSANRGFHATIGIPNGEAMTRYIILPVDATIIDIDVIYNGSNRTGGEIAFYSEQLIAVGNSAALNAPVKLFDLGENAGNPWQPTVNPTNIHRVRTTVNTTIAAGYSYFVQVLASTGGGGAAEIFRTLKINAQFSTG